MSSQFFVSDHPYPDYIDLENNQSFHVTLADKAYAYLKQAIITLQYTPGQTIYESEISEMLGISRTPVREAIGLLKKESLVEIFPQRGTRISYISLKKIEEVHFVRLSLHESALRTIATHWDPRKPDCALCAKKIQSIQEKGQQALMKKDRPTFFQWDNLFHKAYISLLRNSTLEDVLEQTDSHINRIRYLEVLHNMRELEVFKEHAQIFEAIQHNDPDQAARLFRAHAESNHMPPELLETYPDYFVD